MRDLPTGDLFRMFFAEAETLVRGEVALAKEELREEAKGAGKAAGAMGASALLLHTGWLAFVGAIVFALGTAIPLWLSALLVSLVLLGGGAVLGKLQGWDRLREVRGPRRTVQTLKEDRQWAKHTFQNVKSGNHANA